MTVLLPSKCAKDDNILSKQLCRIQRINSANKWRCSRDNGQILRGSGHRLYRHCNRQAFLMWEGGNTTQRGYGHAWRKLRQQILDRDSHLCQHCIRSGRYIAATEVDHIQNKARGGTDEITNLRSLCTPCHKDKTARDNGYTPRQGCTPSGLPKDKSHHWNKG